MNLSLFGMNPSLFGMNLSLSLMVSPARFMAWPGVDREGRCVNSFAMSTMAEIEAAIEQLPPAQMEALAVWLAARRARRTSASRDSDALAAMAGSWQEDPAFDAAVLAFAQVDEAMWR